MAPLQPHSKPNEVLDCRQRFGLFRVCCGCRASWWRTHSWQRPRTPSRHCSRAPSCGCTRARMWTRPLAWHDTLCIRCVFWAQGHRVMPLYMAGLLPWSICCCRLLYPCLACCAFCMQAECGWPGSTVRPLSELLLVITSPRNHVLVFLPSLARQIARYLLILS
jgi:hypothetical protein